MNTFERYLIDNGMHFQGAGKCGLIADMFLAWCKTQGLKVKTLKRSQFTNWIQSCREQGNQETTLQKKEIVIKQYYEFLGTKNNPATNWMKRKREHTLPPKALEKEELLGIYQSTNPHSPVGYRDRCILGFLAFQGLLRGELWELRINDIDFEKAQVFIQGQLRTNSRYLKLEPVQMMHLYDYLQKFRSEFLCKKDNKETDRFFLSMGSSENLNGLFQILIKEIKRKYPQMIDFRHLRASVITHWEQQEGIIEAMYKAGHRYISSTDRYRTDKYDELQKQLINIHPLENMNLNGTFEN